jgi:dTDP-4-amino-4,6-dideoxygalactose transaminase
MMPLSLSKDLAGDFAFYTTFARTALYGALRACFNPERDYEVILPAFTCTVVIDAIVQAGAKPIFVDVVSDTLNMDLQELETKLSPKTRAVISHHYYGGLSTNLDQLNRICSQRGIVHIEDCAHSLGARWDNKLAGSWGHLSVYSFSKTMMNPGGGCITTNDQKIFATLQDLFRKKKFKAEAFKNQQAFKHMVDRYREITGQNHSTSWLLMVSRLPLSLLRRVSHFEVEKVNGRFYQIDELSSGNSSIEMDISMTKLQLKYIQRTIKQMDLVMRKRKDLYTKLTALIPAIFFNKGIDPTCNYFPLRVKDKNSMIQAGRQRGIRLLETWPAFQNCWQGQKTDNVSFMANKVLLIHLDEFLNLKEYEKLARFLEEHRN